MARLTLRTLLAYIDDTLDPATASELGKKVAASEEAKALIERIKTVTRRRRITTPDAAGASDDSTDPNTVAAYLDNALDPEALKEFERTCLESDPHLAEVAACHQILTLILTEPVRVPPRAHQRMYGLAPAPAGDPARQPNKALPVGGAAPPTETDPDAPDTDAALLFGLKRYSASTQWAERVLLFGVAAVLALMLTVGVFVTLSREHVKPPGATPGNFPVALAPVAPFVPAEEPKSKGPESPPPTKVKEPEPKTEGKEPDPKPKEKDPKEKEPEPKPKEKDPDPVPLPKPANKEKFDPVLPPNNGRVVQKIEGEEREKIGRVGAAANEPAKGVVLALRDGAWLSLRAKGAEEADLLAGVPIMALPGYKVTATLGGNVELHLWGNLPEQVPVRAFEARVTPHVPPAGFGADLTLHNGRVYLKARTAPQKVRVRVGDETWDVRLPDADSEVLVELISWYAPGTPFAAKGGEKPRQDGRIAVVSGSAKLSAPGRFVAFDAVPARSIVSWNSSKGEVVPPHPVPPDELLARAQRFDNTSRDLAKALTDLAAEIAPKDVLSVLSRRFEKGAAARESASARVAVFALAALADSEPSSSRPLAELADLLASEQVHWATDHAVVTALVGFVGRDVRHTATLYDMLALKLKDKAPGAERFVSLLRGFVSPHNPDPARVEQLVLKDKGAMIEDKDPAVQQAARWNLLAVDQGTWLPRAVAPQAAGTVVAEWRARLGPPPKK